MSIRNMKNTLRTHDTSGIQDTLRTQNTLRTQDTSGTHTLGTQDTSETHDTLRTLRAWPSVSHPFRKPELVRGFVSDKDKKPVTK